MDLAELAEVELTYTALQALDYGSGGQLYGTMEGSLSGDRLDREVFGSLDTLDNLKKGGRIGNAQAMLGSLLSIKPMIDVSTGVVEEAGRHRTRKKAMAALAQMINDAAPVKHLAVMHGLAPDVDELTSRLSDVPHRVGHIGAVIGTHGGPRVLGVCWVDKK
jgi:DegV family protein with EDD domain